METNEKIKITTAADLDDGGRLRALSLTRRKAQALRLRYTTEAAVRDLKGMSTMLAALVDCYQAQMHVQGLGPAETEDRCRTIVHQVDVLLRRARAARALAGRWKVRVAGLRE
jgi:hypothetical protein